MTPPVVAPPLPLPRTSCRLLPELEWTTRAWGAATWRLWGATPSLWEIIHYGEEIDHPTARAEAWPWN